MRIGRWRGQRAENIMRFPGSAFIGGLLILGAVCQDIVLAQLSQHPERDHRGPAEIYRAVEVVEVVTDAHLTTAAGFELPDSRAW
jgi:hypothetical protein